MATMTATNVLGEALAIGTGRSIEKPRVEHLAALIRHYRDLQRVNIVPAPMDFEEANHRACEDAYLRLRDADFKRREEMAGYD
jgi:hypothetical protein